MDKELFTGSFPSERLKLLEMIKGKAITKLQRFSWWAGSEAAEQLDIEENEVFSLTAGPLLIYFQSGLVIGAASEPSKNSVVIWLEKDEAGCISDEPIEDDIDLYPIDAQNTIYSDPFWIQIIGQQIKDISIIKREPQNALYLDLPNEVGVIISMVNDKKFILSHGLHNNSDDFSVISESHIDNRILAQLKMAVK